ncbi:unnamed protein product [Ectocarpus sp. 12 AP-2014]
MGKKAKRTTDGTEGPRRPETLRHTRVYGPLVLPEGKGENDAVDLELTSKRVYQDTILSIDGLLSPRECAAWIRYGEGQGFERSFHRQTSEMAHRDNGRITLHSADVAAAVFARVGKFVPANMGGRRPLACNSNIRIYRYAVGQRFGKHIDESVDDENGLTSQWTILIYLNGGGEGGGGAAAGGGAPGSKKKGRSDGGGAFAGAVEEGAPLRGGETVFYKGNYGDKVAASFSPRQGACLVHGHGQQCLLHEGAAVTSGVKYLLRTDVMYG